MRARFQALSEKSGESPMAASEVEERFGSCMLERKGEEVVRCSQTDAVGIQRCGSSSFPVEKHSQQVLSHYVQREFARQYRNSGVPEQEARSEEKEAWEENWEDERMANGWDEGAAHGFVVDPAEVSDDVGGSLGGVNPSTPRNGAHARDSSRSPRRRRDKESNKMGDDGLP